MTHQDCSTSSNRTLAKVHSTTVTNNLECVIVYKYLMSTGLLRHDAVFVSEVLSRISLCEAHHLLRVDLSALLCRPRRCSKS